MRILCALFPQGGSPFPGADPAEYVKARPDPNDVNLIGEREGAKKGSIQPQGGAERKKGRT
jgi:hypothetical protein